MTTVATPKANIALSNSFRFEQNWFFPQTKETIFLFTQVVGVQFVPMLFKLDLNTLEYTQIFPLAQEDTDNIINSLGNITISEIKRANLTYNSTLKKYLLTYTCLDKNPTIQQPVIINFEITDWDFLKLESINIYKDTTSYRSINQPPLILDVDNNLVFTNIPSNTVITVCPTILNNPTSCRIVSDQTGNATITNEGCITYAVTTGAGLYEINFSATNEFGTSYYTVTIQAYQKHFDTIPTFDSIYNLLSNSLAYQTNTFQINVLGYYNPNDSGGGVFTWDSANTAAHDGATIIKPNNIISNGPGRWVRRLNTTANVHMWGAKGDGITNDQPAIQRAIDYCSLSGVQNLYFNSSTYFLSSFSIPAYENSYLGLGYYPGTNRKVNINLYGNGATLSANNYTFINGVSGNCTAIFSILENLSTCKIDGFKLVNAGVLCGDKQNSGIAIRSNSGGSFRWGSTATYPINRDTITISNNTFINCHRAINSQSTTIPGSGTNTLNVINNTFLYPKGSDSRNTSGGGQIMFTNPDTFKYNVIGNNAEGVTDPLNNPSPNHYPKDGFIFFAGINNTIANNTLKRFWVETIVSGQNWQQLGVEPVSAYLPAVGEQIQIPMSPYYTNYQAISSYAITTGLGKGDTAVITGGNGIYTINDYISSNPMYCLLTRVSGTNYGGEFASSRSWPTGHLIDGFRFLSPFERSAKYNCKSNIIDNNFTMGICISSTYFQTLSTPWTPPRTWVKLSHDPCVRADNGNQYLSGNSSTSFLMFAGEADPSSDWLVEHNNFYFYNMLNVAGPTPVNIYVPTSLAMGLSGGIARNNKFYLWTDINQNTTTVANTAFPEIYQNCGEDLTPNDLVHPYATNGYGGVGTLYRGIDLHYGVVVSDYTTLVQVFSGNTFYCSNPALSDHVNMYGFNNKPTDKISGNTIVFT